MEPFVFEVYVSILYLTDDIFSAYLNMIFYAAYLNMILKLVILINH